MVTNIVKAFDYDTSKHELKILDQRRLPSQVVYHIITSTDDGREYIRNMAVRGAPCIAAVYILSMITEMNRDGSNWSYSELVKFQESSYKKIYEVRPTAVNLFNALDKLKTHLVDLSLSTDKNVQDIIKCLTEICLRGIDAGTRVNERIGNHGAKELIDRLSTLNNTSIGLNILTHCNTGSLATSGYGTALGVIRSLHKSSHLEHVYCTETRPYNQGSRLTAWELVQEKIPGTLVVDSAVAYLMLKRRIDAVIVGSDCVTKNGDTANKIGTLQLAILADYHKIPFFVAAPFQTIDLNKENGQAIKVECRPADEVRCIRDINLAPSDINVWNPSFDVTPAKLITAIITEFGVCKPEAINDFKLSHAKADEHSIY